MIRARLPRTWWEALAGGVVVAVVAASFGYVGAEVSQEAGRNDGLCSALRTLAQIQRETTQRSNAQSDAFLEQNPDFTFGLPRKQFEALHEVDMQATMARLERGHPWPYFASTRARHPAASPSRLR